MFQKLLPNFLLELLGPKRTFVLKYCEVAFSQDAIIQYIFHFFYERSLCWQSCHLEYWFPFYTEHSCYHFIQGTAILNNDLFVLKITTFSDNDQGDVGPISYIFRKGSTILVDPNILSKLDNSCWTWDTTILFKSEIVLVQVSLYSVVCNHTFFPEYFLWHVYFVFFLYTCLQFVSSCFITILLTLVKILTMPV